MENHFRDYLHVYDSALCIYIHSVYLDSDLVTGTVNVGVCEKFPVDEVDVILGNDLAGGKVFPSPIVSTIPVCDSQIPLQFPGVFPVCAVTRSQARNYEDLVDLSDTFLAHSNPTELALSVDSAGKVGSDAGAEVPLIKLGRAELAAAQKTDSSLSTSIDVAVSDKSKLEGIRVGYYWDDDVLMRKWNSVVNEKANLAPRHQIVLPSVVRASVLKLAHDHVMGGHLGVNKTFQRVSQYFYWPGLRTSVANYCRSCRECQLVGKPNQVVRPVPLCPIPVMGEPFERLILDCVGPLPKSREGYQYILSFMCAATRFSEAVPLRNLKAKTVVKELIKFCSLFGLPRVIQTDRGTNFTSKLFKQVLHNLTVTHVTSSAFHPQSQGALERFHQTLKTTIKTHCLESGGDWAESLPLLMFAIRESVQDSLGFSPAELVFGHIVRGPLKLLSEQLLATKPTTRSVSEYVDTFRKRLKQVCNLARANLTSAQATMKAHYDRRAVQRSFKPGDLVLALLPVPGSALQNRFTGPYVVERKVTDTTYVIRTPERRRNLRTCHINMLKQYHEREKGNNSVVETVNAPVPVAVVTTGKESEDDGVETVSVPTGRLQNSTILQNLKSFLRYLSELQRADVTTLIESFPAIFSDVPSQTNVLFHDIDVGNTSPIMQHPYRVNPVKREIMKSEIKYMLQNGLAVSSQSAWSSPCVLVPKSDGSFRFCTDYRKINAVTKPDSFPLPRIDDCIDRVGPAKFVTKLDLLKGYWQVPLTPRAAEISAFVTPDFFGQYSVMAFGMRNAPATFQRLMRLVLQDVPDCEAYLDDIVIFSPSWEEHMNSLRTVFARLAKALLTVNLAKCEFAKATITYLGKQVGQGQVKPVNAKITAITEFPRPSNRRELRRFLGMIGYYRGFCRNFATLVAPLTDLLRPSRKFVWSLECEHAFNGAKDLLCKAPILAAPDFSRAFLLEVDASGVAAGAVLLQRSEANLELPVCYFSKKFNESQRRYSTVEKEALALLLALRHFDVYLSANPFPVRVYTDHNPLVFLSRMQNVNQRLMRWSLIIQEYNLEIVHKRGSEMVLSDALSRAICVYVYFVVMVALSRLSLLIALVRAHTGVWSYGDVRGGVAAFLRSLFSCFVASREPSVEISILHSCFSSECFGMRFRGRWRRLTVHDNRTERFVYAATGSTARCVVTLLMKICRLDQFCGFGRSLSCS
ncbi:Retrovirus-related Pol polyprotein from transposon 17.6 [Labeo rohita]|uniref:Gypsy retrotransposon integrase-like protein 1 n=1 Tax=Labeo rohita TaxID=84645 RepID=A0ABQ8MGE4_LABRO|nr:Retrovirus-related Pol polyprotein from transposon 17.6 [Labeo rohita]